MDIPPPPVRRLLRPFILHLGLVLVLACSSIGIGLLANTLYSNEQALMARAKATVETLIQSRSWIARHGGVWVDAGTADPKPSNTAVRPAATPSAAADPAAANPALKPITLRGSDGRLLRLVNPTVFLREISGLPADENPKYRVFSQTPFNPANLPDTFEHQAMVQFRNGSREASARESSGGQIWFRYAQAMTVENSCLSCHADQGYITGEQRGGIDVRFPVTDGERQAALQFFCLILLCLADAALVVLIPWSMRRHFIRTLDHMEARLANMAASDELTGLANRRYFFSRFEEEFARALRYERKLAVIMIDIDHFKQVNDFYGHQIGDQALQLLSGILRSTCRQSDLVARYGGEEFVILLSEVDLKGAQTLAEKLRSVVAAASVQLSPQQIADKPGAAAPGIGSVRMDPSVLRFTISLGIACLDAPALKELVPPTRLVALADAALYQAKHTGRNRVTVHQ